VQTLSHVYKINRKHAQISNTIWRRIGPFSIDLVKKIKKIKIAHTHWLQSQLHHTPWDMTGRILLSIQSQSLNSLSTQHSNSKYAGFYTTLGLGHMFVSVQHTHFLPGMWSLHLHREAPNKSVGFLLRFCSLLGIHSHNHPLHVNIASFLMLSTSWACTWL